MEQLRKMRAISLSEPLSEKVRPKSFQDIVGQEDGIKALKRRFADRTRKDVIIYGPPGVGKTGRGAAGIGRSEKHKQSPFQKQAVFVELDATTARFDERGLPIRLSVQCMIRFIRERVRWAKQAFRDRNRGL